MAEGFLRDLHEDRYDAYSAGVTPTHVNPFAIKVIAELGIDISKQKAKPFRDLIDQSFDVVISTCDEAEKVCPFVPAKHVVYWRFPDSSKVKGTQEEILNTFRTIRDSIRNRIEIAVKKKEI